MGRFKRNHFLILLSSLVLFFSFQNCSKIKTSAIDQSNQSAMSADPDSSSQPSSLPNEPLPAQVSLPDPQIGTPDPLVSLPDPEPFVSDPADPGLTGGHFDLDTSHLVYDFNNGKTDHHVHEYDDKYNVNAVDFYNMLDSGFTEVASRVLPGQQFIVIVANADLSPGAILELNGEAKPVVGYQQRVDDFVKGNQLALATYTLDSLKSFKLKFVTNSLTDGLLVPTQTGCVQKNNPGANGEYRNGALTIQILDKNTAQIDSKLRVAKLDGGLLWEATVFWHWDGACQ